MYIHDIFDSEFWHEYSGFKETTDQGLPYDFGSIMHYASTDQSSNGKPTFLLLNNVSKPIGTTTTATYYDYLHINLLYCQGTLK